MTKSHPGLRLVMAPCIVQLSVFPNSQPQNDRALAVAGSIKGVVRINNEISIKQQQE